MLHGTTVEDRGAEFDTEFLTGPTKDSLEDLTDVHTRRHTHRVQYDIYRRTIREERHVLNADDLGYDTLVTVTTGHLITYADLTTLSHINLRHLDDTVRQLITDSEVELLALELRIHLFVFSDVVKHALSNEFVLVRIRSPVLKQNREVIDLVETLFGEVLTLGDQLGTEDILHADSRTAGEKGIEFGNELFTQFLRFDFELRIHIGKRDLVIHLLLAVFVRTAVEFLIDDDTVERRTCLERSILHVTGFVTEDGLEQFLLRRRIGLTLRCDLTDEDITRLDVRTDTNNTVLVEVFGSLFGYIRDIGGELLHTALGVTYFEQLLNHVNRGVHIFTNDALAEHDSILVVITLPRNIRYLKVLTERQFATLCCITLGEDLPLLYPVSLANERMEVDSRILVGLLELRQFIFFLLRVEADECLFVVAIVVDANDIGIYVGHLTGTFCYDLRTAIANQLLLNSGTHDRGLRSDQRNSLAHHVRSHEGTVGIIVLQERNEGSRHRSNLTRRHVHEVDLRRRYDREVGTQTGLNLRTDEATVLAERCVTLCYYLVLLVLGRQIYDMVVVQIHHAILYLTIRGLDETKVVDLRIDTERRDQTDVRTFRRLNRTETTVVGVVYVTYLETGTITAQTTGTEGRHTTFVRDLSQRVLLIHELAQGVRTEIAVDDRRD